MSKPMKKEDERYTQRLSREINTAFENYKPDDPGTHEALHGAFRAQARNVIYYRLGKYDDVLEYDIASRAMVALPSFRGASKLSTWFYTIAQHEVDRALEKLIEGRNRFVQIIEDEDDGEDRPSNAVAADDLQAKSVDQTTKLSVDALEKHLPKEQRKVFALWRSGLTFEQVAEKTGKALGTVLSLYEAAKKNMRKAALGDVHVALGDSGLGKTPWAYQLGLCVATGEQFLGYPTRQGRVIYLDLENGPDAVLGVAQSLCGHLGIKWSPDDFLVRRDEAIPDLSEVVAEYKPSLVIIDTLRPFRPTAEKSNDEMGLLLNELRFIARSAHCTILVLHHVRCRSMVDGCRGARETGAQVRAHLPSLRPRQAICFRTGTQGEGNHRGQRSGQRGTLRESRALGPRHHFPRAGSDLARLHTQSKAQTRGSVNTEQMGKRSR